MRVEDPTDVVQLEAVQRELALDLHLVGDRPDHAESGHDLRVHRAGVDEDRVVAAEDEEPPRLADDAFAHPAAEAKEARVELDVDQVEQLDLIRHLPLLSRPGSVASIMTY